MKLLNRSGRFKFVKSYQNSLRFLIQPNFFDGQIAHLQLLARAGGMSMVTNGDGSAGGDGVFTSNHKDILREYFEVAVPSHTSEATQQRKAETFRVLQKPSGNLEAGCGAARFEEAAEKHRAEVVEFVAEISGLRIEKELLQQESRELKNDLEVSQLALRESAQVYADLRDIHAETMRKASLDQSTIAKRLAEVQEEHANTQSFHCQIEKTWADERCLLEAKVASLERQVVQHAQATHDGAQEILPTNLSGTQGTVDSCESHLEMLQRAQERAVVALSQISCRHDEKQFGQSASNETQDHDAIWTTRVKVQALGGPVQTFAVGDCTMREGDEMFPRAHRTIEENENDTVSTNGTDRKKASPAHAEGSEQLKEFLKATTPNNTEPTLERRSPASSNFIRCRDINANGDESALRGQLEQSLLAAQLGQNAALELQSELQREQRQQNDFVGDLKLILQSDFDGALEQVVKVFKSQCDNTTKHVEALQQKLIERIESLEGRNGCLEGTNREQKGAHRNLEASVMRWRSATSDADKKITKLILSISSNMEQIQTLTAERDKALAKCEHLQKDLAISHQQCIEMRRVLYSAVPPSSTADGGSNETAVSQSESTTRTHLAKKSLVSKPLTKSQALTTEILEAAEVNRYLIQAAVRDTNAEILEYMAATPDIGSPSAQRVSPTKDLSLNRDAPAEYTAFAPLPSGKPSPKRRALPEKEVEVIRHHLRSAAYSLGGSDFEDVLRHADKNHDSILDLAEFQSFGRRVLQLSRGVVSDADLEAAFHLIDTDSSGSVALEEVISFAVGRTDWSGCRSE